MQMRKLRFRKRKPKASKTLQLAFMGHNYIHALCWALGIHENKTWSLFSGVYSLVEERNT